MMIGASVINGARVMRAPRLKPPNNVSEINSVCNEPGVAAAVKPNAAPCAEETKEKCKVHYYFSTSHHLDRRAEERPG